MKNAAFRILKFGAVAAAAIAACVVIGTGVLGQAARAAGTLRNVTITTSGTAFYPAVDLAAGTNTAVTWLVTETGASYTGTSPEIVFSTSGVHHVRLTAMRDDGSDGLGDLVSFNVGFNHEDDAGYYNVGSNYDIHPQSVTAIEGVNSMTGLVRFLAATPSLRGSIDFSGMSRLQYIECFGAKLSGVNLAGCASLIRLCVENNDLGYIDLNPVAGSLCDLRLSGNRSALTIAPLSSPLKRLYHYCAQSITVTGHPSTSQLPAITELFDWNSGQSGALVVRSSAAQRIVTYGNDWTSADLAYQFPAGRNGYVDAHGCRLSAVNLAGNVGLTYLDLHDNALTKSAVDGILAEAASWGTWGGTLLLAGNDAPSAAGLENAAILTDRGWTVTVDANTSPAWDNPYTDVDENAWYGDAVRFVTDRGLMKGGPGGTFDPAGRITRAMFVTILHRLSGEAGIVSNAFSDVAADAWYGPAVGWANKAGIADGVGGTRFAPEDPVSREQMAVMLYRYATYKGIDVSVGQETNILSYSDALSIDEFAYPALQWACGAGIMNGNEAGELRPRAVASRVEAAALLQRFAQIL